MALSLDAMTLPRLVGPDGWPLYLIGGGSQPIDQDPDDDDLNGPDDDDPDEPGDEEPDDDQDPDEPDPDAWTPPSKEEWSKVQAALTKANNEAKRNRLRAKELAQERQKAAQDKAAADAAAAGQTEQYEQALAAAAQAEQRYKPIAVKSAARAAFLEAGLRTDSAQPGQTDARVKRMVRMLDLDQIEIDEDGDVIGLDTQIEEIKSAYPELFGPLVESTPPPRKKVRRINAAPAPDQGYEPALTTGEKIAQQVLGPDY